MIILLKKKRVFVYVRVSTQEQAKEGYSIEEQIKRLKKYCEAMDWIIVKIYTDAGYSGGNTDRPALQDMIGDIETGKGDIVAVYKLDRLSRSQKDTLELIEDVFLENNVDFVSMNENFDTSTSFGRAMIGILAVFAQLEREQIKERMSMGKEGRAKKGKFHGGGNIPVGYDYVDGELKINEYETMQVREAFEMFVNGMTHGKIEKIFEEKGYTHKHGRWDRCRVRDALVNKLYIGYVKYNGEYYEGIHDAIIDKETFDKAQRITESRKSSVAPVRNSSFLGGLLFCKRCTARYCVCGISNYRYYCCHSRRKTNRCMIKDPNCKNDNYREDRLNKIVFDNIRKLAIDPDYIHKIKNENISPEANEKERLIRKEIAKLDAQKSRFMDLYGVGEFTIDEVQEKVAPLNDQKKKLENQLKSIVDGRAELTEEEVFEIVTNFSDIMDRGVFEEIRLCITSLIRRIEIDGDDIDIHWKFA